MSWYFVDSKSVLTIIQRMNEPVMTFPIDCVYGVGEVFCNQYWLDDCLPGHITKPVILDIGANCGAFALWAKMKWPNATVHCYEPDADIFKYLQSNTEFLKDVHVHNFAVGDRMLNVLYRGNGNRLCSSQYKLGRQNKHGHYINVVDPTDLPLANIVKIDAEGAEQFIICNMKYNPEYIVFEYHSKEILEMIVEKSKAGYDITFDNEIVKMKLKPK